MAAVPAVYPIADFSALQAAAGDVAKEHILASAVSELATAGAGWIQVRAKGLTDRELYQAAKLCSAAVAGQDVELWVNDRVDLARLLAFDGVHLGQRDLPPRAARRVVGDRCKIGRSTHDAEQFAEAMADPDVDVVALGPIFPTTSKPDAEPTVGLDMLRRLAADAKKPVVAIGGIEISNISSVLSAGADSAAVIGAVCRTHPGESLEELCARAETGGEDE